MAKITETIKAAAIARAYDKETGKFLGWGVKSNHSDKYYHIHCYKIANGLLWTCDCKAGQHGFTNCKAGLCCHVKAVIEVEEAKQAARKAAKAVEAEQQAAVAEAEKIVAQPVVQAPAIFPNAKTKEIKRAPQFAGMNNRGFVIQAVPELGGRMVPLKVA